MTQWKQHRHSGIWVPYDKPPFGWELDREHPLVKPMTGCWPLNEGGGPNAFNWRNGDNNPLTGCTWAAGGILSDADYERVAVASAVDYLSGESSVAFRYRKIAAPTSYYYWFTIGDTYTICSLLADVPDNNVRAYLGSQTCNFAAWGNLFDGKDHDVVVTWSDANDIQKLYVDGVETGSDNEVFTWPSLGSEALNIGSRADSAGRYAGGVIGYFYTFKTVLIADQVRWLRYEPFSIFKPKPVAKYFYVSAGAAALQAVDGGTFGSMTHVDGAAKGSLTHVDGGSVS